jgi:hypothetical protein
MDFNPRMSTARSSQQSSQQKKPQPDEDAFMQLVCRLPPMLALPIAFFDSNYREIEKLQDV